MIELMERVHSILARVAGFSAALRHEIPCIQVGCQPAELDGAHAHRGGDVADQFEILGMQGLAGNVQPGGLFAAGRGGDQEGAGRGFLWGGLGSGHGRISGSVQCAGRGRWPHLAGGARPFGEGVPLNVPARALSLLRRQRSPGPGEDLPPGKREKSLGQNRPGRAWPQKSIHSSTGEAWREAARVPCRPERGTGLAVAGRW